MSRDLIALALASGIGMDVWEAAGERAVVTAWELLEKANGKARQTGGPQMSG